MEPDKASDKAKNQIKHPNKKKLVGLFVLFAAILIAIYFLVYKPSQEEKITIGDTTITESDVDEFVNNIENYNENNPQAAFEGDLRQQALDDLILNAAFKKEAEERNMPLTDDDLIKRVEDEVRTPQQRKDYLENFKSYDVMRRIRNENEAYKIKFRDILLAEKDLLVALINFDTPLHERVSDARAQRLYDDARQRLQSIRKLLVDDISRGQLASRVDSADYAPRTGPSNPEIYFNRLVVDAMYIEQVSGNDAFNDLNTTSYIRGNVGHLFNTDQKVAELKNVGDTTDVFASKAGAHMVIRLEGKSKGSYSSWGDFLDYYKQEYVNDRLDLEFSADIGRSVGSTIDQAVHSLSSPGLKKAQAQGSCSNAHKVTFRLRAIDIDNGNKLVSGARVRQHQGTQPGNCSGMDATRTTSNSGWRSFPRASCWNYLPRWALQSEPNGFRRANQFIKSGNSPGSNNLGGRDASPLGGTNSPIGQGPMGGSNSWGFPADWNPGNANAVGVAYITLRYKENDQPPQGNLNANCNRIRVTGIRDPNDNLNRAYVILRVINNAGGGNYKVFEGRMNGVDKWNYNSMPNWVKNTRNKKVRLRIRNITPNNQVNNQGQKIREQNVRCGPKSAACDQIRFTMPNQTLRAAGRNWNNWRYAIWVNDFGSPSGPSNPNYQTGNRVNAPLNGANRDYGVTLTARGASVAKNLRADNKIVSGNLRATVIKFTWFRNNNGVARLHVWQRQNFAVNNCYRAKCDISVANNVPSSSPGSNAVQAGRPFTATVRLENIGRDGNTIYDPLHRNVGYRLSATLAQDGVWGGGGLVPILLGTSLDSGNSDIVSFGLTAPNTPRGQYQIRMYPDYWGRGALGGICTATVNVYGEFNMSLGSSISMDDEEPDRIGYGHSTSDNHNSGVAMNWTRRVYRQDPGHNYRNAVSFVPFGSRSDNGTVGPPLNPQPTSSQNICVLTAVGHGSGWVGPGNHILNSSGPRSTEECVLVGDYPYTRSYGADIWSSRSNGVQAYTRVSNGNVPASRSGSGVEFAAIASEAITGYASSSLVGANPTRLSFSNTTNVTGGTGFNTGLGGRYGPLPTLPNYFNNTQYNQDSGLIDIRPSGLSVSGNLNSLHELQTLVNGNLTISGTSIISARRAIYVNGDVNIRGNIFYTGGSRTDPEDIPYLAIIATGDINIANNVGRVDGLYIAQNGTINTCTDANGNAFTGNAAAWINSCSNQLRINGAFIARDVRFHRLANSLRNSDRNESAGSSNAAEIFQWTPEFLIGVPPFPKIGGGGSETDTIGKYDSVSQLPPIF